MYLLLLIAGPATYLMRSCGLLLARTRLVPRQMESSLALVTTSVLAALVAPALLLPAGRLVLDPLANPRLLVALLVIPLLLVLRRNVQTLLLGTPVVGMGLLLGLGSLSGITFTLSLPLALLLLACAGFVLLVGRYLHRLRLQRSTAGSRGRDEADVKVIRAEDLLLPSGASVLQAQKEPAAHLHCCWCWCPLPAWALYCGHCGLPQQAPALAVTQPLSAVPITPVERKRTSLTHGVFSAHQVSSAAP